MTEQYWVGDFFIDITRNQITQKTQSQKIPPKALAVLTCLAKNANNVVSHDEILSQVWPDTVVTPNTLQRSIAQLRKALGEHSQSYIKTHAKQGYSLEVEVRWQAKLEDAATIDAVTNDALASDTIDKEVVSTDPIAKNKETESATVKQPSKNTRLIAPLLALAVLAVVAFNVLMPSPLNLEIAEFNSLTATDDKEYSGIYTPDGKYVVFQRYSEKVCRNNNIWAKNTKTKQEFQLTKNMGSYGSHSFSKDGKTLVFIDSNDCDTPINQKQCYKLMSLDFERALKQPQSPSVLVECKNSRIARPKWLDNNNIALVQEFSNRWKLTSYSVKENKSSVIYELEEGNIVYFDYSPKDDLIALTRIHSDGQQYLDMLKPDGERLSSHQIELPKEIPGNRFIYPNFTPYPSLLIFSTGRQLFTLSYDGKISNISLPLNEPISSPIFHPTESRMLVIKGHYDSDIAMMPLSQMTQLESAQNLSQLSNTYSIMERSIQREDNAQFQPGGELIAYQSNRSGRNQLWVTNNDKALQISNFPLDTFIYEMDWAADGKSMLINANKELTRLYLDSHAETIAFAFPIEKLFQWHSEDNTALVLARINGVLKFAELDLNNAEYKIMNDKKVTWAGKSEDGRLIYTDQMEQFWQSGPVEDQRIEALVTQGSDNNFIIKDNVIYGINADFQLWSYALDDKTFNIIGNMPEKLDYITDINQTDILLTMRIAAKKEVAEIILAN
ncbi:transcriptional regulator [Thalassotalea sp. HSM 43]|uniref:winged helix-turn-helix domain-containing protein n=1 Tax=Thalassotalea sp. HSM 43 TaxID=2552945 RepID=UPI001080A5BE|nr:winged helix-turn-helix domain-containing protein [Thalassotalea sp. HSM 43]QBY03967.1 transcriptional regulator [Thalassotalea sp. HSM 43]